ncbi:putative 2-oxoglutarate-Fe(II) type oxidoreductase Hxnyp [[Candida] jaroonii]|uniref:2-oxoglutarate-Fe(II) type oxidoreductase Hxnyp n=1 Tax=[Candida] jaroonii TaxID=467808 RepID=A0ACA9YFN0_9ASCO|nr:putative 2-oxoglutarate-Fe(II) type oxidoreductase Hxnyp [[Candida] jaroonii]
MSTTVVENKKDFLSFSGRKREVVDEEVRKADFSEIPVISLNQDKESLIKDLKYACKTVGFFYIKDHGVPQESIDKLLGGAKTFFELPKEDKNEIHFSKSKHFRGYESCGDNNTEEGKRPDLNEQFNWGYEAKLDPIKTTEEVEEYEKNAEKDVMAGPNVWPAKAPALQTAVAEYYGHVLILARRLVKLFALALDLPETYFDNLFQTPGAIGRVLHYFPQASNDKNILGIGAHTDIECFTILYQGKVPALQVLNNRGEWIQAPPIDGTFVINIGDMLARWSNDVFISTVHRVLNLTGNERYSIPVFIGTQYDTMIEPLYTCVGEEGPKYKPIRAGEYVYKRLAFSRLSKEEYEEKIKTL